MADNQSPELFGQTPSQTVGPFFHYALPWRGGADLVGDHDWGARIDLVPPEHFQLEAPRAKAGIEGEIIVIEGRVLDGDGQPIVDALIELWQADASGSYARSNSGFIGFGRSSTDNDGVYRFRTLKPGRAAGPNGALQAPHIAVGVLGRGLLKRLATRLYFDGDPANGEDAVLALVPAERRPTLLARKDGEVWRFDIVLQGAAETVFFDL